LAVAFRPGGKGLATASSDKTVRIWDVPSARELLTFHGHANGVNALAFNPDGRLIASGGRDGLLKVWDPATGQVLRDIRGHSSPIVSLAFSTDGRLASASGELTVKLWDPLLGEDTLSLRHPNRASALAFSPDGKQIATADYVGKFLRVWDTDTGVEVLRLRGHEGNIPTMAFSPDGSRLTTGSSDGTVKLWDAGTGKELCTLRGFEGGVHGVAFAPDGTTLATVSRDGALRLWNLADRQEIRTIRGPSLAVAFTPDGRRLASDGPNNQVLVWDAATGHELLSLEGHSGHVHSVAFSPDGRLLASAGEDRVVRVWDAQTGEALAPLSGHSAPVNALAFSPDSSRLVSGGSDMTVRVWETATWQNVVTLSGHTNRVDGLAFSRDGHRIASASFDGTVRIWDAAPLTAELREQREAGRVVRAHLERVLVREELAEAVRRDRALSDGVRRRALALANRVAEDPVRLNDSSWSVVRLPGAAAAAYQLALRQAERACELEPANASFLGTLGTARYRAGDWKRAIAELEKAIRLRWDGDPANANEGFFLAMAHWQLGAKPRARDWFDKSVAWMAMGSNDPAELQGFRAEAAKLLGADKKD
jgi:WD40 repeat protein